MKYDQIYILSFTTEQINYNISLAHYLIDYLLLFDFFSLYQIKLTDSSS